MYKMKYDLLNATNNDIKYIKDAKIYNIFNYAHNLPKNEILMINNYIDKNISNQIPYYKLITVNNIRVGCLLVIAKDDGVILDEIYLDVDYRNKGIGTNIIKDILEINPVVYLWVYKQNVKAVLLYKKMKFEVIEETDTRYYMKYIKR